MNIRKLQRQAAAYTDELLAVSEDIGRYVISAYGIVPGEMLVLQCRALRERVRRLVKRIRQTEEALESAMADVTENGSGAGRGSDPAKLRTGQERAQSVSLTLQLLAQDRMLLAQKECLLEDFLLHSHAIQSRLEAARDMAARAEILQLQNTLRRELSSCPNENEDGN